MLREAGGKPGVPNDHTSLNVSFEGGFRQVRGRDEGVLVVRNNCLCMEDALGALWGQRPRVVEDSGPTRPRPGLLPESVRKPSNELVAGCRFAGPTLDVQHERDLERHRLVHALREAAECLWPVVVGVRGDPEATLGPRDELFVHTACVSGVQARYLRSGPDQVRLRNAREFPIRELQCESDRDGTNAPFVEHSKRCTQSVTVCPWPKQLTNGRIGVRRSQVAGFKCPAQAFTQMRRKSE